MDEKTRKSLIKELYFTAEAAEYLEISTDRLAQIIRAGEIRSLKENSAEAIFLREDLDAAARSLKCHEQFAAPLINTEKRSSIRNDSTLQKAMNYFTLQSYYDLSNERAEAVFLEASAHVNMAEPIEHIAKELSKFVADKEGSTEELMARRRSVYESFSLLKKDVFVVDKDAEEYPARLKDGNQAPAFLFMWGNAELLNEAVIGVVEGEIFSEIGEARVAELIKELGSAGIIAACISETKISPFVCTAALQFRQRPIFVSPIPLNQVPENETSILQQGLSISPFPPHRIHADEVRFTAEELLFGISNAVVVVGDENLALIKGSTQQEKIEIFEMVDLYSHLEKLCRSEPMRRNDAFSKGIEVEYVFNSK